MKNYLCLLLLSFFGAAQMCMAGPYDLIPYQSICGRYKFVSNFTQTELGKAYPFVGECEVIIRMPENPRQRPMDFQNLEIYNFAGNGTWLQVYVNEPNFSNMFTINVYATFGGPQWWGPGVRAYALDNKFTPISNGYMKIQDNGEIHMLNNFKLLDGGNQTLCEYTDVKLIPIEIDEMEVRDISGQWRFYNYYSQTKDDKTGTWSNGYEFFDMYLSYAGDGKYKVSFWFECLNINPNDYFRSQLTGCYHSGMDATFDGAFLTIPIDSLSAWWCTYNNKTSLSYLRLSEKSLSGDMVLLYSPTYNRIAPATFIDFVYRYGREMFNYTSVELCFFRYVSDATEPDASAVGIAAPAREDPEMIYDITGMAQKELRKGINIIRQGGRTFKVIK